MHGGRTGGAGVFHPGRRLEAQMRIGIQRKGGGKALLFEAAEIAHIDGIDVGEVEAGVLDRLARGPGDEVLQFHVLQLAELRMRPTDDRGHHFNLLVAILFCCIF